ncbi:Zinc carboxypeptidase A 1 [Cytospora mali]|uniref:Zinc carboxypeptidase A 1 n=1 Tax=Cytospora mali TaxID=578113 RepID=A0A194WAK4_CYTMA|nr:Zinc carboxypeptidase A 1 [Valsa mali]
MHLYSLSATLLSIAWLKSTHACLLPEELDGLSHIFHQSFDTGIPIGTGDRFNGGAISPQGLGTRDTNYNFDTLLSVAEIKSGFDGLANEYGFETFMAPHMTYEGAIVFGGKVGGSSQAAYRVYLNAAIHARERGSSDGLLYFMADLLHAYKTCSGVTYSSKTYSNVQVQRALSVGIVFVPLSNPDGVAYDQSSNSCWRKNRNPAWDTSGVDLNRNFGFLWDFTAEFSPSVQSGVASTYPQSPIYHGLCAPFISMIAFYGPANIRLGSSAFSEPETQNIKWVMDTFTGIQWFIDLHSYGGKILYSWGSDTNQNQFRYMNFANNTYDGVRGILTDTPGSGSAYGEYTPQDVQGINVETGNRVAEAMSNAVGRKYASIQGASLYPTSGSSDDYSYSRHFSNSSLNLIHGYTVEFGFRNSLASCPFYPSVEQYNSNLREVGAGFMELLLAAADFDLDYGTS